MAKIPRVAKVIFLGLGGVIRFIKVVSVFLIRASEVPFLVPAKSPKLGLLARGNFLQFFVSFILSTLVDIYFRKSF